MTIRGASFLAALTIVTLAGCASRQTLVMPNVDSRRAVTLAAAAATAGRHLEALSWYEQILATPNVRPQDRRAALRGTAILRLSTDPKLRDLAKSQALLKELTATNPPGETDSRAYEAQYVLTLVEEFNSAQAEAAKRAAELGLAASTSAGLSRSLEDTRKQAIDAGLSAEQTRTELERLRAQEQTLRRELQALQADRNALQTDLAGARVEIQRKDTALRKVAATLAGLRRAP